MDLDLLRTAIARSWVAETSDDRDGWTPDNPCLGQCAVTSMVVRDYLGGEVRIANVLHEGQAVDMHCWVELPDGDRVDWTTDQFDYAYELGDPLDLQPIVDETGVDRHVLLADRVAAALNELAAPCAA